MILLLYIYIYIYIYIYVYIYHIYIYHIYKYIIYFIYIYIYIYISRLNVSYIIRLLYLIYFIIHYFPLHSLTEALSFQTSSSEGMLSTALCFPKGKRVTHYYSILASEAVGFSCILYSKHFYEWKGCNFIST